MSHTFSFGGKTTSNSSILLFWATCIPIPSVDMTVKFDSMLVDGLAMSMLFTIANSTMQEIPKYPTLLNKRDPQMVHIDE